MERVLKAFSIWILAKYTYEYSGNGLNSFEVLDEKVGGVLSNVYNSKNAVFDFQRAILCPTNAVTIWDDGIKDSIEKSFFAASSSLFILEEKEKIEENASKLFDEIVEELEESGEEIPSECIAPAREAIKVFVVGYSLSVENAKILEDLLEYAEKRGIQLNKSFKNSMRDVAELYSDDTEKIVRQAIKKAIKESIKTGSECFMNKATDIFIKQVTMHSPKLAATLSSVISGIGLGYSLAEVTIKPCDNAKIFVFHVASIHVAREYAKIERELVKNIANSEIIDLNRVYEFLILRKMMLSSIGMGYKDLAKVGDLSLLNKFVNFVGTNLGYVVDRDEILRVADTFLYPSSNTELLTPYLFRHSYRQIYIVQFKSWREPQ